jgi:hypothetical protein
MSGWSWDGLSPGKPGSTVTRRGENKWKLAKIIHGHRRVSDLLQGEGHPTKTNKSK